MQLALAACAVRIGAIVARESWRDLPRQSLKLLALKELRQRAADEGVAEYQIEQARDSDDVGGPKVALIALIVEAMEMRHFGSAWARWTRLNVHKRYSGNGDRGNCESRTGHCSPDRRKAD